MSYSVGQIHKYSVELLPQARGRNRPECRLQASLEHSSRPHRRTAGTSSCTTRASPRRSASRSTLLTPAAGEGNLAALRDRRHHRRHPASRRRLYPAGRPHPGAGQGRARAGRRDQPQHHRHRRSSGRAGGEWLVKTDKGDITCEHVVSCDRQFRPADRRDGRPRHPGHPGRASVHRHRAASGDRRAPAQGPAGDGRAARGGLAPGTCARRMAASCSAPTRTARPAAMSMGPSTQSPNTSSSRRTSTGWRRISRRRSRACRPSARSASRRSTTAPSPIRRTARPIIGPAWDLPNFWLNEGHSFGVTAAGGAGWQLAEWIVDGEPTIDMMGVDPRRFGPYATEGYLKAKNEEAYANVFTPHYPDEERSAARPLKTRAVLRPHEGARRGVRLGLWLGAAELVRAAGLWHRRRLARKARRPHQREPSAGRRRRQGQGDLVVPPLQLFRACRQRDPQRHGECRPAGHVALRQGDRLRAGRARTGSIASSPTASRRRAGASRSAICCRRMAACAPSSPSTNAAPGGFYLVSAGALERHDHDTLRKLLPDGRLRRASSR